MDTITTILDTALPVPPRGARCGMSTLSTRDYRCHGAAYARCPDGMPVLVCKRHFRIVLGCLVYPARGKEVTGAIRDTDPERVAARERAERVWAALRGGSCTRAEAEAALRAR